VWFPAAMNGPRFGMFSEPVILRFVMTVSSGMAIPSIALYSGVGGKGRPAGSTDVNSARRDFPAAVRVVIGASSSKDRY